MQTNYAKDMITNCTKNESNTGKGTCEIIDLMLFDHKHSVDSKSSYFQINFGKK